MLGDLLARAPHVIDAIEWADRRVVYLDTTYGDPRYSFPEQAVSIEYCVTAVNAVFGEEANAERKMRRYNEASQRHGGGATEGNGGATVLLVTALDGYPTKRGTRTLFLVGTYFIGKEKILLALARCCRLKIYAPSRIIRVYREMDLLSLPDQTDHRPPLRDLDSYCAALRTENL